MHELGLSLGRPCCIWSCIPTQRGESIAGLKGVSYAGTSSSPPWSPGHCSLGIQTCSGCRNVTPVRESKVREEQRVQLSFLLFFIFFYSSILDSCFVCFRSTVKGFIDTSTHGIFQSFWPIQVIKACWEEFIIYRLGFCWWFLLCIY